MHRRRGHESLRRLAEWLERCFPDWEWHNVRIFETEDPNHFWVECDGRGKALVPGYPSQIGRKGHAVGRGWASCSPAGLGGCAAGQRPGVSSRSRSAVRAHRRPGHCGGPKHIQFHLYHKEEEGQDRALALLVLSIVEPSDEPSYLRIELQEESLPGNPDTE